MNETDMTLEQALELPVDELYRLIGIEVEKGALNASIPNPKEAIEIGKAYIVAKKGDFCAVICTSERIKKLVVEASDEREIAVGLLGLVVGLTIGVNPVHVTVLLAKKGLKLLCRDYWTISQ